MVWRDNLRKEKCNIIINLVGPPCSGKSTFAARYVLEHPEFKFCPIDAYRVEYKEEELAWQNFCKDILESKDVIVESCGLGWRLRDIFRMSSVQKRRTVTISFIGKYEEIYKRLVERQHKRPIDYEYDLSDEFAAILYVLEHLHESVTPIDLEIDTSKQTIEEQYQFLCEYVTLKRTKELKRRM